MSFLVRVVKHKPLLIHLFIDHKNQYQDRCHRQNLNHESKYTKLLLIINLDGCFHIQTSLDLAQA